MLSEKKQLVGRGTRFFIKFRMTNRYTVEMEFPVRFRSRTIAFGCAQDDKVLPTLKGYLSQKG
jgi:hypothetical protein